MQSSIFLKNVFKICLLSFIFFSEPASAQNLLPDAAPATGEGFTDDYTVILEGRQPISNFLEVGREFSSGEVDIQPWSDSYWPTFRGLIASRYNDSRQPNSTRWSDHYNFYRNNPPQSYVHSGNINQLSPAEKYDLLIGNTNWSMTQSMWQQGKQTLQHWGVVPGWNGICHGWAAASQVGIPQPTKEVTVADINQRPIKFYPFDLQALVSYLWSRPQGEDLLTGRRCRKFNVTFEDDRIVEPECFDINPMTLHLGALNRAGAARKSFVMDTSFDSEVWNYVLSHYQVSYFNPATQEFSYKLEESVVSLEDFPHVKWLEHRNPEATHIVGVVMDAFHPGAITPHAGIPKKQLLEHKRFVYDLELDDNFEVIGGEWYGKKHPDFIWLYPEKYNPFIDPETNDITPSLYEEDMEITAEDIEEARRFSEKGRLSPTLVYKLLNKSLTAME